MVCLGVLFNGRVIKVDDPCGAISVHGYCGWLGAVVLGIFADGTYGAGWNGVGATSYLGTAGPGRHRVALWRYKPVRQPADRGYDARRHLAFGLTFLVFKLVNAVRSMRVSTEIELEGLDVPQFGMPAYPEDMAVAAES